MNFFQMLNDSFNFINNQRKFILRFVIVLTVTNSILELVFQPSSNNLSMQDIDSIKEYIGTFGNMFNIWFMYFINLFLLTACFIGVHTITKTGNYNLPNLLKETGRYIGGIVVITLIKLMPIILTFISVFYLAADSEQSSPLMLPITFAIYISIYVSIRLVLANYIYITKNLDIKTSLTTCWQLARKHMRYLILFCIITSIILPALNLRIATFLSGNEISYIFAMFCSSFIQIFTVIFSYRFYILYITKPR